MIATHHAAVWFGYALCRENMQAEALKRNLAHYDPKTGKCTWNEKT